MSCKHYQSGCMQGSERIGNSIEGKASRETSDTGNRTVTQHSHKKSRYSTRYKWTVLDVYSRCEAERGLRQVSSYRAKNILGGLVFRTLGVEPSSSTEIVHRKCNSKWACTAHHVRCIVVDSLIRVGQPKLSQANGNQLLQPTSCENNVSYPVGEKTETKMYRGELEANEKIAASFRTSSKITSKAAIRTLGVEPRVPASKSFEG
ncbi:hypothetical protein B0H14DRAFT_2590549 [Mycena olivaceomarginata]|nr:hypothetical protein B0H14DRAFT_2590549 [Mycena olivaceomarginata]